MVDLDDAGDPVGDQLRDRMDPIWLELSEEDRAALELRIGDPSRFAGTLGPLESVPTDAPGIATRRRDLSIRRVVRAQFRRAA